LDPNATLKGVVGSLGGAILNPKIGAPGAVAPNVGAAKEKVVANVKLNKPGAAGVVVEGVEGVVEEEVEGVVEGVAERVEGVVEGASFLSVSAFDSSVVACFSFDEGTSFFSTTTNSPTSVCT
jgi:hypothetical protein